MGQNSFRAVAANPEHPLWETFIQRENSLYNRNDDVRSPFARDYTRILHSKAYRRLKHKTQVFFNVDNDHICTRMEHVALVDSVACTIAKFLGLNEELTKAIAIGHDLGHAPFGHQGERIISRISEEHLGKKFWHEQNGLRFVDRIELLEDSYRNKKNLNLTYAVRDGIISHCGEVDENGLKPRKEMVDLKEFIRPNQFQPATWEGCVVKISDKIAYIGRDIEDAMRLGFFEKEEKNTLLRMARENDEKVLNTTVIMYNLIIDLCENSDPERGITLSEKFTRQMDELKSFNLKYIYKHPRLGTFNRYSEMVLNEIFDQLMACFAGKDSWEKLKAQEAFYPSLVSTFSHWLARYADPSIVPDEDGLKELSASCINEKIYGLLDTKEIYTQAVIDYISGMTDGFAIRVFEEFLSY